MDSHSVLRPTLSYTLTPPEAGAVTRLNTPMTVRFDDVWFGYEAMGRDVLKGLSFEIAAGQMVALVGEAGAGKSHCAGLLLCLWEAEAGTIHIGGADVRDLPSGAVRDLMALVPQECSLLHEQTVGDALRLGLPGATCQQIEAAARQAQVHEAILRLPDGYDTPYGAWTGQLTAGERQRIAMARVMLGNAPVVIFHETASRLNAADEAALQRALSQLRRNRTVLVISHRLSTIRMADSIIVVEQGVVVEEGRHKDLLAWNDRYARLIATQTLRD